MAYLVMLEADHYRVRDPIGDDIRMVSSCMFRHRTKGFPKPPSLGSAQCRIWDSLILYAHVVSQLLSLPTKLAPLGGFDV